MAESLKDKTKSSSDLGTFLRVLPFHKLSRRQAFVLGGGVLLFFTFIASLLANFGEHTAGVLIGEVVVIFTFVIYGVVTNLN